MVERKLITVAHFGWRDWLAQRVTAVVMLIYTLFFLAVLVGLPRRDYNHWRALWDLNVMKYATLLFIVSLLIHVWIGMRNILMDYVKDTGVRLVLFVVVILALVAQGAWAWQILWGM